MTRFTEQLHTLAHGTRLTDAERSRVHAALRAAMTPEESSSPYFIHAWTFRAAVAFAVVLVITGGTAYAAEGALPGDLLYSVKVDVNEPVTGALAFTPEAKAAWHTQVAETRLAEAEALAEKGTLDATTSNALAADFNEHANAVASISGDVAVSDPKSGNDISARFSSVVAHRGAAILAAGKKSNNEVAFRASGDLVVNVASHADEETERPAAAPALFKASVMSVSGGAEDASRGALLSERTHAALADATSTLAALSLTDDERSSFEARVADIETLTVKADAELSSPDRISDATDDYRKALTELADFKTALEAAGETDSGDIVPNLTVPEDTGADAD
jgi:hypothetical protein